MKKNARPVIEIKIHELLLQTVGSIVNEFADAMTGEGSEDVLKITADLYCALEVNCKARAELTSALAAQPGVRLVPRTPKRAPKHRTNRELAKPDA